MTTTAVAKPAKATSAHLLQPPAQPRLRPLRAPPRRIVERDGHRRDWGVILKNDETLFDCLQPEFLGGKAHVIKAGDRVEIRAEDFSMWAELLCIGSDELVQTVTCVLLHGPHDLATAVRSAAKFDFDRTTVEATDAGYRVRYGHTVLRSGFANREAAEQYLARKKEGAVD